MESGWSVTSKAHATKTLGDVNAKVVGMAMTVAEVSARAAY